MQSVFTMKVRTQVITLSDLQQLQARVAHDLGTRRFQVLRMLQGHFQEEVIQL
jgi:hypothetical protein